MASSKAFTSALFISGHCPLYTAGAQYHWGKNEGTNPRRQHTELEEAFLEEKQQQAVWIFCLPPPTSKSRGCMSFRDLVLCHTNNPERPGWERLEGCLFSTACRKSLNERGELLGLRDGQKGGRPPTGHGKMLAISSSSLGKESKCSTLIPRLEGRMSRQLGTPACDPREASGALFSSTVSVYGMCSQRS